jgi:hypothetical protein
LELNVAVFIMPMYTADMKIIIASIISSTVISLNNINRLALVVETSSVSCEVRIDGYKSGWSFDFMFRTGLDFEALFPTSKGIRSLRLTTHHGSRRNRNRIKGIIKTRCSAI